VFGISCVGCRRRRSARALEEEAALQMGSALRDVVVRIAVREAQALPLLDPADASEDTVMAASAAFVRHLPTASFNVNVVLRSCRHGCMRALARTT
jgi:hypothetical protein